MWIYLSQNLALVIGGLVTDVMDNFPNIFTFNSYSSVFFTFICQLVEIYFIQEFYLTEVPHEF